MKLIFLFCGIFIASIFESNFSKVGFVYSTITSFGILTAGAIFYKKSMKGLVYLMLFALGISLFSLKLGLVGAEEARAMQSFEKYKIATYTMTIIDKTKDEKDYKIYLVKLQEAGKLAYVYGIMDEISVGEQIKANFLYKAPPVKRNFGDMDYKKYLNSKGINIGLTLTGKVERLGMDDFCIEAFPIQIRNSLEKQIDKYMSGEAATLAKAMILGDVKLLEEDLIEAFRDGGVSHVLSVSGLHVGYFYLLFNAVFSGLKKSKGRGVDFTVYMPILLTLIYVVITGFQSPAVRSFLMFTIPKAGATFSTNSKSTKKNYLSITGTLMLIFNPFLIYDVGFLISFSCIFAMSELCFGQKSPNNPILQLVALSTTAWLGSLPIILWSFGNVSIAGIISNIPIIPLSGACTVLGILAILLSFSSHLIGGILFYLCEILLNMLTSITRAFAEIFPVFIIPRLPFIVVLAIAAGIYYLFSKEKKIIPVKNIVAVVILAACFQFLYLWVPTGQMEIDFLDVGQGDSAIVHFPAGGKMMIDGGPEEDMLISVLSRMGFYKIDTILITHAHEDHAAGAIMAIKAYRPKTVILPMTKNNGREWEPVKQMAVIQNFKIVEASSGDVIEIGGAKIKILLPDGSTSSEEDENSEGIVCLLSYKKFDCLFTADSGISEEEIYTKDIIGNNIEIIKIPHHGSKYSSGEKLIETVKAKIGIISVGRNMYGHPSGKIISDYLKQGTEVLRTDRSGAVKIFTRGETFRVRTVR